jgi:ElaB/YqjD/DUF883 family membrane-anchored ribosome-binding protein
MTQRVTLTYSVELEQLEQETQRLYDNATTLLAGACDRSSNECEMLSTTTLSQIEQLRHNLAAVDVMLSDIGQIIQSYIQYRFQQDVPAVTVPDISVVENALSQLNDLKETMANEPHPSQEDLAP